ncbi:MAG: hypothetical protein IPK13_05220 [Deltaproteobacteria bacterium]|nr:hypothetical protein [Deltaproteobacteria bacterium]
MWQEQPIAFHYEYNTKLQSDYLSILVPVSLKYPFYLKPVARKDAFITASDAKSAWEISMAAIADARLAEALIRSCDDPRFCSLIASDVPFTSKFVTLPETNFDPAKHKYRNEEKRFTHLILLLAAPQRSDGQPDLQFTGKFLTNQIELLVRLRDDLERR